MCYVSAPPISSKLALALQQSSGEPVPYRSSRCRAHLARSSAASSIACGRGREEISKYKTQTTLVALVASIAAGHSSIAQTPLAAPAGGPAWETIASWDSVQPTVTKNIVYANVPRPGNPSANPNPGTPGGIVPSIPNSPTAAPGTMDLHLDVLQVHSQKPTPVVIQLHGGGWIRGDRPNGYETFRAFLAAGMSVVTVQYRNAKDAPAPAAIQDVRCAMAWVNANAAKYNFDPTRVVTYGESAGGHLALMAGYAPASFTPTGCKDQPKVAAILDFLGPTNLAEGLTDHGSSDFTHQWLGTDTPSPPYPAEPTRDGSKPSVKWPSPDEKTLARAREMSPMTYIKSGLPPTFIVYGDIDRTVDPKQDLQLIKALDEAGIPHGVDVVVGRGHGGFTKEENDKSKLLCLEFLKAQGILQ
jgi:acetyl esterase/lipase